MYVQSYKMPVKGIKEDLSKWSDMPYLYVGRFSIVKTSVLPKLIFTFSVIIIKMSAKSFLDTDKIFLKMYTKREKSYNRMSNNFEKEE